MKVATFNKKTTDTHNIMCMQIQKAWRQFAKNRNREDEEPHSDWAMVATVVCFDILAQIMQDKGPYDPLVALERINDKYGFSLDARHNKP